MESNGHDLRGSRRDGARERHNYRPAGALNYNEARPRDSDRKPLPTHKSSYVSLGFHISPLIKNLPTIFAS